MVNKKKLLLFLVIIASARSAPNNPNNESRPLFYETKMMVAMDVVSVIYGAAFGGYQLLRFIQEIIPYKRRPILAGYSENDLRAGPLNSFCRACLEEQSSRNFIRLYDSVLSDDLSDQQASEYRKKVLSCYNLYQFPVFREFIKKWPEYSEHIVQTHSHIKSSKKYRKLVDTIQGFKKGEFANYIQAEYQRVMGPLPHLNKQ